MWQNVCLELNEAWVVLDSSCCFSSLSSSLSHLLKLELFVSIKSDTVLTVLFPSWSCRTSSAWVGEKDHALILC